MSPEHSVLDTSARATPYKTGIPRQASRRTASGRKRAAPRLQSKSDQGRLFQGALNTVSKLENMWIIVKQEF